MQHVKTTKAFWRLACAVACAAACALIVAIGTAGAVKPADTKPPDTSITGGPAEGAVLNSGDATFHFSGTDDNTVAYYEVKNGVDDTFVRATSPKAYEGLSDGFYSFRVRAVDAAGNADPTPAVRNYSVVSSPVASNLIKVIDFGATANDTTNDTAAFERAMVEAAKVNGVAYVPAPGTYRISSITPPSNTHLQVQAGVILKKYGTTGGPLFNIGGPTDTTFRENVHIEGVGGNFTMDLNDAGQETSGIRYRNVRHFSLKNMVCRQNWDNHTQEAPSSRRTCLTFLPTTSTPTNGVYNHPTDGTFENIHSKESPYGWGLTQLTGGENLRFFNISSEGGVPLRLESYRGNWTPIDNIIADGVTCTNGHDAVHVNPHDGAHGTITLRNIVANSCESALSLKNESTGGGSFASDSTVSGVTVLPGNQAQLRDPSPGGYVGAWVIGGSKWSIDNDKPLGYTIGLSNVDDGGLSYRRP